MVRSARAAVGADASVAGIRRQRRRSGLLGPARSVGCGWIRVHAPGRSWRDFRSAHLSDRHAASESQRRDRRNRQANLGAARHRVADGARGRNAGKLRRPHRARLRRADPRLFETAAPASNRLLGSRSSAESRARSRPPRESSPFRRPVRVEATLSRSIISLPRPTTIPISTREKVASVLTRNPGNAQREHLGRAGSRRRSTWSSIEISTRALNVNIGQAASAIRAAYGGTLATQFDTSRGTKYVQVIYPPAFQTTLSHGQRNTLAQQQRLAHVYRRRRAVRARPIGAADDAGQS